MCALSRHARPEQWVGLSPLYLHIWGCRDVNEHALKLPSTTSQCSPPTRNGVLKKRLLVQCGHTFTCDAADPSQSRSLFQGNHTLPEGVPRSHCHFKFWFVPQHKTLNVDKRPLRNILQVRQHWRVTDCSPDIALWLQYLPDVVTFLHM